MRALWVGQPVEVRQRQKTALIALISKDNKIISVLLPKHFRIWGFSPSVFLNFFLFFYFKLVLRPVPVPSRRKGQYTHTHTHTRKDFCFKQSAYRIDSSTQPYPAKL